LVDGGRPHYLAQAEIKGESVLALLDLLNAIQYNGRKEMKRKHSGNKRIEFASSLGHTRASLPQAATYDSTKQLQGETNMSRS
jgi:hypothetical protein